MLHETLAVPQTEQKTMGERAKATLEGKEAQGVEKEAHIEGEDAKGNEEKEQKEEPTSPKSTPKDISAISQPSPQPNFSSYYKFIEGGIMIPQKLLIPLFY